MMVNTIIDGVYADNANAVMVNTMGNFVTMINWDLFDDDANDMYDDDGYLVDYND